MPPDLERWVAASDQVLVYVGFGYIYHPLLYYPHHFVSHFTWLNFTTRFCLFSRSMPVEREDFQRIRMILRTVALKFALRFILQCPFTFFGHDVTNCSDDIRSSKSRNLTLDMNDVVPVITECPVTSIVDPSDISESVGYNSNYEVNTNSTSVISPVKAVTSIESKDTDAEQTLYLFELIHGCIINHSYIFPRCSVLVHHGGVGTTETGLRYFY